MTARPKLPSYTRLKYGRLVRTTTRYTVELTHEDVEAIVLDYARRELFPPNYNPEITDTDARNLRMTLIAEDVTEERVGA